MKRKLDRVMCDLVVVGGGLSGLCAALSAARLGVKTVLVQDRPVLGGNASSEIRMHVCGADRHGQTKNARETGIIEELLLKNRAVNPQHSFSVQDTVLWAAASEQEGLKLFLNTRVTGVEKNGNKISGLRAHQLTTEKIIEFSAEYFVDATGDGFVGYLAGAKYMQGRESKAEFGEPDAPEVSDTNVMGSTILFTAKDIGQPAKFVKPEWAYSFSEEDLLYRDHKEITSGYWWLESAGDMDTITDSENIRDELLKILFGVWDHIKNSPGHGADNYVLDWIGSLPGKRESRRLVGDYVLKQQDIAECTRFEDAVAYGGWTMDIHHIKGFWAAGQLPTYHYMPGGLYGIPYRCLYSANVDNLFLAGRIISASHMAFGSTRVMGTCAVVGQAVGTAAAIAKQKGVMPRGVGKYIKELQQTLLKYDAYIPNIYNEDENDLARQAKVTASSSKAGCGADKIINGVARNEGDIINCYISDGINPEGESLELEWEQAKTVNRVMIKFDSDLSGEITISLSDEVRDRQKAFPPELVKDYDIVFYRGDNEVRRHMERNNILRFNDIATADPVNCDKIELRLFNTYGAQNAIVYEVRVY